jgi:transposase
MTVLAKMAERIQKAFRKEESCQKIAQIKSAGPTIATAIVAAIADVKAFRNGRQLTAWLGLVPRRHSSRDKQRLLGISKRGDPSLRMLLIHGARSIVYRCTRKRDPRSRWIADKQKRLGTAKA